MKKLLILFTILALVSCSAEVTNEKPQVVATIGMIGDVAQNIGGDLVEVETLMGPGVDPHLYKASQGDVATLANADLILYNGLHLEARLAEVLESMGDKTTAVSETIDKTLLLGDEDYENQYDPHVWFDVELWKISAGEIRDAFIAIDPDNKDTYMLNADAYMKKLDQLDLYVTNRAESIPEDQRVIVTAHDAFRYFGQAYGFEVVGLQGISTEAEAGTADVQEIVDFIVDRKIKAIFVESSIPERNIKAVQEAAAAKGWTVDIGGELFSDAMGDEGTQEGTYIGMVNHNIDTIVGALS